MSSSGEEEDIIQIALDYAYSSSPTKHDTIDPAERSPLLLRDKDFLDSEGIVLARYLVDLVMYCICISDTFCIRP